MTALIKQINSPSLINHDYAVLHQSISGLKNEVLKLKDEINKFHNNSSNQQFLLPANNGHRYVSINHIVYCVAKENYCNIYLQDGSSCLLSKTLKKVEESLNCGSFIRCHQTYLINQRYIHQLVNGICQIKSPHHQINIPISRRRKIDLLKELNTL